MAITDFFDTVERGISDAEAFEARIYSYLSVNFGKASSPIAAGIAKLHAMLQRDCAELKIVVDGVEQACVMTETVYNQVMAFAGEAAKLAKMDNPDAALSELIPIVGKVLAAGIPLALTVVSGGAAPTLMLALPTIEKLAASLL